MNDTIYREDAIKALRFEYPMMPMFNKNLREEWAIKTEGFRKAEKVIMELPSVDRPQGEWIHNPNGIDRDFIWWKCSNCGNEIFSETEYDREKFHAFCGKCGARMK